MSAQTSTRTLSLGRVRVGALAQPWLWVTALTLLAFFLRRYHLGVESLWFDEADIVRRAQQPASTLIQGFTEAGENGPLYTLLLHFWLLAISALPQLDRLLHIIFGGTYEAPVRGLSAIFGTAAIPLMYRLAKRVGGPRLGLLSAALLAVNPFHIWHSQDAKMYTLLVLMTLASTLLYVEALERNRPALWAGYVLATWVMLTTHSMAALVLLAQLAATPFLAGTRGSRITDYILRRKSPAPLSPSFALRGRWVSWGWAMLLILAPLFPIVWLRAAAIVTGTIDAGGWYSATGLTDILLVIFVKFAVNQAVPPWEAVGGIAMALLAFMGAVALLRPGFRTGGVMATEAVGNEQSPKRVAGELVLLLWAVPVFAFWLITTLVPLFQARYLIMALPAYIIMVSAGLLALGRLHPTFMVATLAVIGLPTAMALTGINYSAQVQKEDWRGALSYVQDHLRLRDVIVVFPGYLRTPVDVYYKPGGPGHVPDRPVKTVQSLKTQGFGPRELDTALHEAVRNNERAWVITSPPRQAQEDPENKVLQWFQYNWHTFDTKVFNGVTVYGISFNGQPDSWFPEPDHKEAHTFVNGVQFLGYIYEIRDNAPAQPDASYFPLTLYWRTSRKLTTDYLVRVRIKDKSGHTVVDEALGPLNGLWPTSQWPSNTQIIDYRDLRLPGGLTPGDYTVTVELYPAGQPDQPLKLQEGGTEIVFNEPLKVVPWKP